MRVIQCPKCSGALQVAPYTYLYGATRECPLCGTLIQLASEHAPLPAHRLQGRQQTQSGVIEFCAVALLGIAMLCLVIAAVLRSSASSWSPSAASSATDFSFATTVLQCDRHGLKGRIRNNSGAAVSRVAVLVRVFENGNSTPIIRREYHVEPPGGIERGNSVDFELSWQAEDSRVYERAKGRITVSAETSALTGSGG